MQKVTRTLKNIQFENKYYRERYQKQLGKIATWRTKCISNNRLRGLPVRSTGVEHDNITELKELLWKDFAKKCAFCERKMDVLNEVKVVFFWPTDSAYQDIKNKDQKSFPHYGWLIWELWNLFPACGNCSHNAGYFPLADDGSRITYPEVNQDKLNEIEKPLLLDPCVDKPAQFLQYDENGLITPRVYENRQRKRLNQYIEMRVKATIDRFQLNSTELLNERSGCARNLKAIWDEAIRDIRKTNSANDPLVTKSAGDIKKIYADNSDYVGMKKWLLYQWLENVITNTTDTNDPNNVVSERLNANKEWGLLRSFFSSEMSIPPKLDPKFLPEKDPKKMQSVSTKLPPKKTSIDDRQDRDRFVSIIARQASDANMLKNFLENAFASSSHARNLVGNIQLSGATPNNVAMGVLKKLEDYGDDIENRHILVLLIDQLRDPGMTGKEEANFLSSLVYKYGLIKPVSPAWFNESSIPEAIVDKTNPFLDAKHWTTRLNQVLRQVCRVKFNNVVGGGSGFLVGPDLVLTNYHVMADVILGRNVPTNVVLQFDYLEEGSKSFDVQLAKDWRVDDSELDLTGSDPDKIDYALIRLKTNLGKDRGWIERKYMEEGYDPSKGRELFIVQHPQGRPLSIAFDQNAVIDAPRNSPYLHYRTNTEPGSSGSPCFDKHWNLVALHHCGQGTAAPQWNEGILIKAILDRLQKRKNISVDDFC